MSPIVVRSQMLMTVSSLLWIMTLLSLKLVKLLLLAVLDLHIDIRGTRWCCSSSL